MFPAACRATVSERRRAAIHQSAVRHSAARTQILSAMPSAMVSGDPSPWPSIQPSESRTDVPSGMLSHSLSEAPSSDPSTSSPLQVTQRSAHQTPSAMPSAMASADPSLRPSMQPSEPLTDVPARHRQAIHQSAVRRSVRPQLRAQRLLRHRAQRLSPLFHPFSALLLCLASRAVTLLETS
jgi:hypothetical protein